MRSVHWRKPSPSLVISVVALFVALTGSAFALSKGEVKSKHIDRNAVKSKHINRNAVKSKQIRDGAVGQAKLASGVTARPSGPAGGGLTGNYPNPTIANGAVGQANLAGGVTARPSGPAGGDLTGSYPNPTIAGGAVTNAKLADGSVRASKLGSITEVENGSASVADGATADVTAPCPPGTVVLSGGLRDGFGDGHWGLRRSQREGNGWRVTGINQSGNPAVLNAYAYCLAA